MAQPTKESPLMEAMGYLYSLAERACANKDIYSVHMLVTEARRMDRLKRRIETYKLDQ